MMNSELCKKKDKYDYTLNLTDLHTFSYSINWENLSKDQNNFLLGNILFILITFSLDKVLICKEKLDVGHLKRKPQNNISYNVKNTNGENPENK